MDSEILKGLHKFCIDKSKNIKLKAEPQVFVELANCLEELEFLRTAKETIYQLSYNKGFADGSLAVTEEIKKKYVQEFAEKLLIVPIAEGGKYSLADVREWPTYTEEEKERYEGWNECYDDFVVVIDRLLKEMGV